MLWLCGIEITPNYLVLKQCLLFGPGYSTIARLVEKKGVEYGLRAVAKLRQNGNIRVRYRIAGDGPLREELETLAGTLGIAQYKIF